ncbi:acetyl-CoA carboxylase biotin carboxylase subunit [Salicibibacter kimchii]|uniref:biotin carboxylase n=1 Tax=Salicibibacter kimchii TaxID=2099786 RepID=A0A345BWN9_9BACI|nr:biotin carboxylase N-terminal domain-containing protein [Salicibibacter kimchii]AXF55370.1 ATP-grasp domain-containing protein [Salicibibacter kimchii]
MFKKVLVANRGAIAARIIRALKELNVSIVAVYSEADKNLSYLDLADEAYGLGGSSAKDSYLNQALLIDIIKRSGTDAVHPGYGFLSENTAFASKLEDIGVHFIGPSSALINLMGDKNRARQKMSEFSMPVGKGSGVLSDDEKEIKNAAKEIGYPVLVKPANGGGGIGMFPVYSEEKLLDMVKKAKGIAEKYFSDQNVYLEKYFEKPRHVEFQILADANNNVMHLYERDCSIQRRHQKIIEESPAPNIPEGEILEIAGKVQKSVQSLGYDNVGTVEMLRGQDGSYSFLEMNTRLQVEHAVTEEVLNIDLVKAQVLSAAGVALNDIVPNDTHRTGHAIEVRIYAEDPITFYPAPGTLKQYKLPEVEGIRVETGFKEGNDITPYYDPMIAKIIAHDETRKDAITKLVSYLETIIIEGVKTNIPFLIFTLESEEFLNGDIDTDLANVLVERMKKEKQLQ